jgi:ParB-like chromosome segregation protein Spo0J
MSEFPQYKKAKVSDLIPYARNSRTHSDAQVSKISASIKEFGFLNPVIVDGDNGIIAGHGRILAAQKLGLEAVPTIEADHLTEAQRRAYIIADNRLALDAGWDDELLRIELGDLDAEGFDLSLTGFDLDEIANLTAEEIEGLTDEDAVPEVPEVPITVEGDVWLLGRHRLMCGDSTSIDAVDRLMDGRKADMVFTDPPYGIAYSSSKFDGNKAGVTNKRNKAEMIIGDGDDFDPSFLAQMFKGAKEMFVWGYQYYPDKLGRGGIIVWNKKRETEAANPHGDFELCWSRKERNKMCWLQWGGFKNKEKGEDRLHTTQKPVALALWFFGNWGNGLACVVDLFGGSGSTLIACEKTNRDCRMMELDSKYCDVIIKRWQDFTGKDAIYEPTGQTYQEMANVTEAA